jgi:subfamily B ATP-binding cassette protein MsbA
MNEAILKGAGKFLPREWRDHLRQLRALKLVRVRDAVVGSSLILLSLFFEAFSVAMVLPLFQFIESGRDVVALAAQGRAWAAMVDLSARIGVPISLLTLSLAIVVLITLRQYFNYRSVVTLTEIKQRVGRDISARLFRSILSAKPAYLQEFEAGRFVNLVDVQSQAAATLIRSYATLVQYMITFAIYAAVMLASAPAASIVALAFTGLIIASLNHYVKLGRRLSRDTILVRQSFSSFVSERFQAWRTIKLYGALDREAGSFGAWAERFYELSVDMFRVSGRMQVIITPVMSFFALSILYVSVEYIGLSVSQISLFILILLRLIPVAQSFASQRQVIATNGVGLSQVIATLDDARRNREIHTGTLGFEGVAREIAFDDVTFAYAGRDETALDGITVSIPAGRMTAIMGPSGSGKSTLVDLLAGFSRPTGGRILFDGVAMDEFAIDALRGKIAYASQSPFVFNASAYENVLYARPTATREEVEAACRNAFAHEFIQTMPEGYETRLGEGGVKLSGGQRQRLALARAFLADARILILDEPTSALDYESERKIQAAVEAMARANGTTVVVVAHRISTVSHADHLVVLDRGKVIEQGPPEAIRAGNSWYRYAVELDADPEPAKPDGREGSLK